MPTKYIIHDKKIRCSLRAKRDFIGTPIIELRIEVKHWYGWVRISSSWNIDLETRRDYHAPTIEETGGRIMPYLNPRNMHYQMGGEREVWDESTLNPIKRAEELLTRFANCRAESERKMSIAEEKVDMI